MYALWRVQILATVALFSIFGIVRLIAGVWFDAGPPLWLAAFWVVVVAWNAY
jgi:hypothetical protein